MVQLNLTINSQINKTIVFKLRVMLINGTGAITVNQEFIRIRHKVPKDATASLLLQLTINKSNSSNTVQQ
ncbi:MAG: hypothetical protein IPN15_20370 [Saprospiraceae bacterium]|nr:hypothetical protein [Candidatus Vicinibacter affinis]